MNTVVLGIVKTDFHFCVLFNRSYEQCVLDPTSRISTELIFFPCIRAETMLKISYLHNRFLYRVLWGHDNGVCCSPIAWRCLLGLKFLMQQHYADDLSSLATVWGLDSVLYELITIWMLMVSPSSCKLHFNNQVCNNSLWHTLDSHFIIHGCY